MGNFEVADDIEEHGLNEGPLRVAKLVFFK